MYDTKFIVHVLFWIGCGSFLSYTIALQFLRYYENADTPKISFKQLHDSAQDDVYPDITICFTGPVNLNNPLRGNIYNSTYLRKYHSMNKIQYNDLLIGSEMAWNEMKNPTGIAYVDFDQALLNMDFISYALVLPSGISNITKKQIIRKSFQIPGMVCFTRTFGPYLNGTIVVTEKFRMNLNFKAIFAAVFVHHPGQMLRAIFGRDRSYRAAVEIASSTQDLIDDYEVKLSQMSVLKRRPDAVDPCNPTPTDDIRFWEELFSRIPCLPGYWKWFSAKNSTLDSCNDFKQFSWLNKFTWVERRMLQLQETEDIISSFIAPCNEMGISVSSQAMARRRSPSNSAVEIRVTYKMQKYQEIRNEKDFGMETLWSSIGGYLGLFVGYSLLSLLDKGYDCLMLCFKTNTHKSNSS